MEKSLDREWAEVRAFKNLKAPEQEKELENQAQQRKGVIDVIFANFAAIKKAEKDLEAADAKSENIRKEYDDCRLRRQNAVSLGEDDSRFKISISDLMVEQDRIEDLRIGLRRRIENLRSEGDLLEQEKIEIEKTILRFRLVPLVGQYNKTGEQLAGILRQIIVLGEQLGESFYEIRTAARTIFYSQFAGVDCIAKLFLGDEVEDPKNKWPNGKLLDIFNLRYFQEELRQEREKAAEALRQGAEKAVEA